MRVPSPPPPDRRPRVHRGVSDDRTTSRSHDRITIIIIIIIIIIMTMRPNDLTTYDHTQAFGSA